MSFVRRFVTPTVSAAAILLLGAAAPASAHPAPVDATVTSSADDGIGIAITVFETDVKDVDGKAPVILHSHGWGGSRSRTGFTEYLDAGLGVVSIDQRGHGESGGEANVEDPDLEGQDIKAVIDHVAALSWVKLDAANDPVLGAIGGSYGGGYQWMTALTEVRDSASTRFNALAPDISWNDLPRSLAPMGVVRGPWVLALYAAGAPMVPQFIHEAFVLGAIGGEFPDGTLFGAPTPPELPFDPRAVDIRSEFFRHSPAWFPANGFQLDVPVLLSQGLPDNLFNLNEGWHNFEEVLTPDARAESIFIGHNGGHALPNVFPIGGGGGTPLVGGGGDVCSGAILGDVTKDRTALTIAFFQKAFAGLNPRVALGAAAYNLTTPDGACVQSASLAPNVPFPISPMELVITPTAAGVPIQIPVAEGPMTVAGIPILHGKLTTIGLDARAFVGLSVGTNPLDARVVQNNVMPIRAEQPVIAEDRQMELPGVAVEVGEGETLFLTVSAISDMFAGFQSRLPGVIRLEEAIVELPLAD